MINKKIKLWFLNSTVLAGSTSVLVATVSCEQTSVDNSKQKQLVSLENNLVLAPLVKDEFMKLLDQAKTINKLQEITNDINQLSVGYNHLNVLIKKYDSVLKSESYQKATAAQKQNLTALFKKATDKNFVLKTTSPSGKVIYQGLSTAKVPVENTATGKIDNVFKAISLANQFEDALNLVTSNLTTAQTTRQTLGFVVLVILIILFVANILFIIYKKFIYKKILAKRELELKAEMENQNFDESKLVNDNVDNINK
ncbi:hypothetical protein ACJA23_03210 [Mycoplasma corogypsi]|uniref:hypothetical protein n=1 Tax=Mycoplasma corogypsi TaxID=2106 RepID=UPI0038730AB0